ncbi:MAG TPA: hypothetical protein DDW50_05025 [Firmicutes bacterium]|nr:hypothetical protein [Bacillota bacterium]
MAAGEVIFVIALNCFIIFLLYKFQQKSLEKRMKHLKNEIQDLEDLVAAIIEEFQEIAQATDAKANAVKNAILESTPIIESDGPVTGEQVTDFNETNEINIPAINPDIFDPQPVNYDVPKDPINEKEVVNHQTLFGKSARPVTDIRHQHILELWDQGLSIEEIAKNLGTGRGEVQLILGIYRRS